ncbi:MAG: PEP-CTERM sorting domain-containing protein [Candidatus Thiodiazotropha sp.]|jgi:hypothetical protein
MRLLLAFYLALISQTVFGIVIEPDDYAAGTDLSHISPYVTLTSTDGDPVIAAEIPADAADGYDTKGLGDHAFGVVPDRISWGSEWNPGLSVTFEVPVISFSILIAELYPDAATGVESVLIQVFDSLGNTLLYSEVGDLHDNAIFGEKVYLGPILDTPDYIDLYWYYHSYTYTAESIGGFIIGGCSEPTSLDRLEFTVPEPSSALLLLTGLLITGFSLSKKPLALSR